MRDVEIDARLTRQHGNWTLTITGPRWMITDIADEITQNGGSFALGSHSVMGGGDAHSSAGMTLILRHPEVTELAAALPPGGGDTQ